MVPPYTYVPLTFSKEKKYLGTFHLYLSNQTSNFLMIVIQLVSVDYGVHGNGGQG